MSRDRPAGRPKAAALSSPWLPRRSRPRDRAAAGALQAAPGSPRGTIRPDCADRPPGASGFQPLAARRIEKERFVGPRPQRDAISLPRRLARLGARDELRRLPTQLGAAE